MKKVVSLIIIISMLFSTLSITAYAEENADISSGSINTVNGKTGQAVSYQGISKNGIIYMLPDDIAAIGEYECKSDYIEREQIESIVNSNSYISKAFSNIDIDKTLTDNRFEYLTFSRNNTTDYITKIFYHDGQATTMNKIFEIEFVNYEGKTYLNLEKMLYLMHAQWHVTDTNLYYYPLGNNIFDFIGMNFNYMYENRVQHNSLLMNGEDKWTHSTRVVISHIFNDIDMRMFVPFFGSDMIQQEWYEEGILQLATLDDSFIDNYGSEQISKHLEGSSFDKIDTYSSAINAAIDETVDIIELFEKSSDTNLNKFSRWNNVSNLDTAQLEVIKRKVSDVADVVNIVEIVEDFNEVKTRSKEWGNDFVRGLDLLSTINEDEYADYGKDIIKVSEDLLDEFVAPTEAAAETAMFNSYEIILDKLLDELFDNTIIGHIESIVILSNAVIKSNPDYAKKIENADLMNTVHALINVENVFLSEFVDFYHEYLYYIGIEDGLSNLMLFELLFNVNEDSQKTTENMAISDIRNSLEMFLKTSLRNKTYVYHFNCVFNNTSNWEQTEEAIELENDIYKTYALLSELILTRDYDELLYLDETFGSMYSDKDGLFREKMNVTVLNNSDISDNVIIKYEMRTELVEFYLSNGTLYYYNEIEYPFFLGNSKVENIINQHYVDMIAEFRANNTDYDALYQESLEWEISVNDYPYYDNVSCKVTFNERGAVSIDEIHVMWSGGMHPYHHHVCLNYDINTSKELTYLDIMDGTNDQIDDMLGDCFEKYVWTPKGQEISILKESTAYALTKDGLCFYYNVGDAVDCDEIIVPYTSDNTYIIKMSSRPS